MSTSRSTENSSQEKQPENILALVIDADDCFQPPDLPIALNISFFNWVVNHLAPLLENEILYINAHGFSKVILCLWTNRQDVPIDLYNAERYYQSQSTQAYPYEVFGRCAPLLPILQSYLANRLKDINCEVLMDTALKGDLDSGVAPGTTYKQMLTSIAHPRRELQNTTHYNYDQSKISLLQTIASRIATAFPQSNIFLKCFDDLPDVINQNYLVFKNFNLLPTNVREINLINCYRGEMKDSRRILFTPQYTPSLSPRHFFWLNFYLQSLSAYNQSVQQNAREMRKRLQDVHSSMRNLDLAVESNPLMQQQIVRERADSDLIKTHDQLQAFVYRAHTEKTADRSLSYQVLVENKEHLNRFIRNELSKITEECPGSAANFTTAANLYRDRLISRDWLYNPPVNVSVAQINIFTPSNSRDTSEQRPQQSCAALPQSCV